MPVPSYDLPIANNPTATEEPKIINALNEVKGLLTAGLDTDNLSTDAGILLGQLEPGSSGQVPIVNTAGSLQYRDITGDIHISQAGVANIQPLSITNGDLAGSISFDKLAGSIPDTKLATPAEYPYRLLHSCHGRLNGNNAGQYAMGAAYEMFADGAAIAISDYIPNVFRYSSGDYDVTGRTTTLLMRCQVDSNATNPNTSFLFNICPYTTSGAASQIVYNLGTPLGTSVTVNNPGASNTARGNATITEPTSDDDFVISVTTGGTIPANSVVMLHAQLYIANL